MLKGGEVNETRKLPYNGANDGWLSKLNEADLTLLLISCADRLSASIKLQPALLGKRFHQPEETQKGFERGFRRCILKHLGPDEVLQNKLHSAVIRETGTCPIGPFAGTVSSIPQGIIST